MLIANKLIEILFLLKKYCELLDMEMRTLRAAVLGSAARFSPRDLRLSFMSFNLSPPLLAGMIENEFSLAVFTTLVGLRCNRNL